MFCHKCGYKLPEDAAFCHKCGTKLITDDTVQQAPAASALLPSVQAAETKPVTTTSIEDSPEGLSQINTNKDDMPKKSEAVIHGHSLKSKAKTKVYCDDQYVGTVGRDESISVPILTDSTIEFKSCFVKKRFPVKSGEYNEFKIEISTLFGNTCVFDLHSPDCLEKIEKMKKRNKVLRPLLIIIVIALFVIPALQNLLRGAGILRPVSKETVIETPYENSDAASLSSQTQNTPEIAAVNFNQGEVLYNDIPVSQYFYCTEDDLKNTLGAPDYEGYAYAGYCYEYDGIEFIIDDTGVTLIWAGNPSLFTVDGITLDKNQAELIAALGEPNYQGWDYDEGLDVFEIQYTQLETPLPILLTFRMSDPNEKASLIIIRPYTADSDDVYGYEGDAGGYNSGFRRADYFTGLSQTDLLRYPDNHLYSKVYFSGYTVNNVMEPRVYLVRNGNNYLVIDDRNGSGANTVDNDKVSVYGTFYGNQTISFTDGRNQQVPHIVVDKLVINSILPQDPDDFAQAYVETVNRYSKAWSDENEYLSGTTVKLILGSSNVAGVSDYFMPVEAEVFTSFYVDGYSIPYFNIVIDGEPIGGGWSGSYGKMDKLPIPVEKGKLYVVVGNLELLFGMDGSSHARLHFESIEPYE